MGNRLTRITTRTGDDGSTGLATGARLPKDSARIEVMGDVDELNSVLGMLLANVLPAPQTKWLLEIQHDLFDLGAELALPGESLLPAERVAWLEERLEEMNAGLPPLQEFILPGGGQAATVCHLARAVTRRAERHLVHLAREEEVTAATRQYLNRLSDLLFVMARVLAREAGDGELFWRSRRVRESG
ncbi:cob(I)yrinic acid a,c-diamide adenosyltransferase [Thioalkalivibrio sp.]|uniref:cob(I)yrinic acid a,c-diamide adenosyltransferase n=1 Tax=Thioalkalivibrio sp. TaxID=2093813 RepID=UPI0012D52305|nr:cob(I)yrinic acid a,c-diamide adenosyltransferase [Thioalkalivibrio sp.]TVP76649.1 MAG: cob(I)yrinic acid a,c-diamide adenosyltransferase [Thioalkalivibrio sp.]